MTKVYYDNLKVFEIELSLQQIKIKTQMKYILYILIFSFCTSFSQNTKKETIVTIENEFNEEAIKWFKSKGNSSIKGISKFKSKGGEIRFGKEFWIELLPFCAYTKERLYHIYKNDHSGYVYIESGIPKFTPDPEAFHDTIKVMCNE